LDLNDPLQQVQTSQALPLAGSNALIAVAVDLTEEAAKNVK
jgi:hypothetical protein